MFAKTDTIHRQQEGVPKEDILLGLCYAMIRNYKATIVRSLPVHKPVVFTGGVTCNAGVIRDEITAQARAASVWVPEADTVFEIGGQDSKYISPQGGVVADFQMNKICAAGTGSSVEEQAARMGIPIGDFGPLALRGEHPCDLGERCTVFIETAIVQAEGGGSGSVAARRADGRRALCRPRRHARAAGPAGHPDVGETDAARGADIRPPPRGRNRLAAVGSPLCVTSLNEGILDTLDREGYQIARIPLGEMLWVLWRDNGTAAPE